MKPTYGRVCSGDGGGGGGGIDIQKSSHEIESFIKFSWFLTQFHSFCCSFSRPSRCQTSKV